MIQEKLESCQDTVAKLLVFHPAKEGKSQQENPYTNNYLSGETLLQNILSISKTNKKLAAIKMKPKTVNLSSF